MATTTLPLLEDLPATRVARAVALVVLLEAATKEEAARTLGVLVQARALLSLEALLAKEEALAIEVLETTAMESLAAKAPKAIVLDLKVVTVMVHQDQVLKTPLETVAGLVIVTTMLLAMDHHQAQGAEAPLEMEEADQATMTMIPQTTLAQAEILMGTKVEAAHDRLALRRTLEALPMAAQATTTIHLKVVHKEVTVPKAMTSTTMMKIAHLQHALPEARHQLNRQSFERHPQPMSLHLATQSSPSPQTLSKPSPTTSPQQPAVLQAPDQEAPMVNSRVWAVVVKALQTARVSQGLVKAGLLLMPRRMLLLF